MADNFFEYPDIQTGGLSGDSAVPPVSDITHPGSGAVDVTYLCAAVAVIGTEAI